MNFGEAIYLARRGKAIRRADWNGKNMFVVFMSALQLPPFNTQDTSRKVNDRTAKWIGEDAPLNCLPYFAMYTANQDWLPGWLASQSDMLAEDWQAAESPQIPQSWDEAHFIGGSLESQSIYRFANWLTTRDEVLTISDSNDSAPIAKAAAEYLYQL